MLAFLLALVAASPALARDVTVRASLGSGFPDLLGVSASLTSIRPLELELGLSTSVVLLSGYARAGLALPLADNRQKGGGVLLEGLALAGYRYLLVLPEPGDHHAVDAVAGIETTIWLGPFAIDGQFLAGATVSPGTGLALPNVRLAGGLAF